MLICSFVRNLHIFIKNLVATAVIVYLWICGPFTGDCLFVYGGAQPPTKTCAHNVPKTCAHNTKTSALIIFSEAYALPPYS